MSSSNLDAHIRLKRAYEPPDEADGVRILVDRLWPRGITKRKAKIDQWIKDIAPTAELRKWFGHDPDRWQEFKKRYTAELKDHAELVDELVRLVDKGTLTLVFGARDEEHNDAVVLRQLIIDRARTKHS